MPRVKSGPARHQRKRRVLKQSKGFRGGRNNLYRSAKEAVEKSLNYAYRDRRTRKRDFRRLWVTRINAAARLHGLSYSRLIHGLKLAGVDLDRRMLADIAVVDAAGFGKLAELAKEQLAS